MVLFSQHQQVQGDNHKEPLKSEKKVERGLIYATDLRSKTLLLPKGIVKEPSKPEEIINKRDI